MKQKRTIIGVIGSGTEVHSDLSIPLGHWIAEEGFDLINGSGGGVMGAVAQGFSEIATRKGLVIGVLPSDAPCDSIENRGNYRSPPGYPNRFVDLPIRTHLHLSGAQGQEIASRNHIIILTADIVIALPGGPGTRSEIKLALEYGKPLIILNPSGEWNDFKDSGAKMVESLQDIFKTMPLMK